jgi:glutamate racemase
MSRQTTPGSDNDYMPTSASPIVVLDSGLGGLTVAGAIRRAMPGEDLIYFGDTARVPYGCKSAETVAGFVQQIVAYLQPYRPKHVVIACNTATAVALPAVKRAFPHLSISGVIEPGARAAVVAAGTKPAPMIAVIATESTARSKAYEHAVYKVRHHARMIIRPTPLLASIIEDGRNEDDPLVRVALTQYLRPLLEYRPDVLVLGCTHYPVFKKLISQMMGTNCRVIDSAEMCAQDVLRRIGQAGNRSGTGSLRCFVTDDPKKFRSLAGRFYGEPVDPPTLVPLDWLDAGISMAVAA